VENIHINTEYTAKRYQQITTLGHEKQTVYMQSVFNKHEAQVEID